MAKQSGNKNMSQAETSKRGTRDRMMRHYHDLVEGGTGFLAAVIIALFGLALLIFWDWQASFVSVMWLGDNFAPAALFLNVMVFDIFIMRYVLTVCTTGFEVLGWVRLPGRGGLFFLTEVISDLFKQRKTHPMRQLSQEQYKVFWLMVASFILDVVLDSMFIGAAGNYIGQGTIFGVIIREATGGQYASGDFVWSPETAPAGLFGFLLISVLVGIAASAFSEPIVILGITTIMGTLPDVMELSGATVAILVGSFLRLVGSFRDVIGEIVSPDNRAEFAGGGQGMPQQARQPRNF